MQQEIKFSILVPVYNVEKYLVECLKSVLSQTYGNFELILVDDGSTDSSGAICDEYAQKDSRIKVFHKPNGGQISARNTGVENATGDYVVFLDSDDYIRKDTLEVLLKYITEYGSDCIVYGFSTVNDENQVIGTIADELIPRTNDKRWVYIKVLTVGGYNAVWRKAVKRELVGTDDLSMYHSVRMGEDLIQTMEILQNAQSLTFISELLYFYRDNPCGIMHTYRCDILNFTCEKAVYEFLKNSKLFNEEEIQSYKEMVVRSKVMNTLGMSYSNLVKSLNKIYYHPFIADRKKGIFSEGNTISVRHKFIYFLFEHRMFNLLAGLAVLRRWMKG